jgi:putative transcriptional regulator
MNLPVTAPLSCRLGVSRQTINSMENDRYTPSLPLALVIGRFFDRRVEEVFDDDQAI